MDVLIFFHSVFTGSPHSCRDDKAMTLTSDEGYISSIVTQESGVGSTMCPWKISLSPGQRINLTLYDFGIPTEQELDKSGGYDPSLCYQYALITERRWVDLTKWKRQRLWEQQTGISMNHVQNQKGSSIYCRPLWIQQWIGPFVQLVTWEIYDCGVFFRSLQYCSACFHRLSQTNSVRVCSGQERVRSIHLSRSNRLEIRLTPTKSEHWHFILKYEGTSSHFLATRHFVQTGVIHNRKTSVCIMQRTFIFGNQTCKWVKMNQAKTKSLASAVGCATPEVPIWGFLEQSEWEHNRVTVRCNSSDVSWILECVGNKWVAEGIVTNCTKGKFQWSDGCNCFYLVIGNRQQPQYMHVFPAIILLCFCSCLQEWWNACVGEHQTALW